MSVCYSFLSADFRKKRHGIITSVANMFYISALPFQYETQLNFIFIFKRSSLK